MDWSLQFVHWLLSDHPSLVAIAALAVRMEGVHRAFKARAVDNLTAVVEALNRLTARVERLEERLM